MAVKSSAQLKIDLAATFTDGGLATASEYRAFETDMIDSLENPAVSYVNVTSVEASEYDLLIGDYILNVKYTATGAVTSLTLPTAQVTAGRTIIIKDTAGNAGTNNITVDTEGSETIDGDATWIINGNYDWITLFCDGTNWFIIG